MWEQLQCEDENHMQKKILLLGYENVSFENTTDHEARLIIAWS